MTEFTMGCYARLWGEIINTAIEFDCGLCGNIYLSNEITIFHQIQSLWDVANLSQLPAPAG